MDTFVVFLVALGTALATGLGALPLLWFRELDARWVALSGALAAGTMAGAALGLFYEGGSISLVRTLIGAILGALTLFVMRAFLARRPNLHAANLQGETARGALLVIGVMTVHSFSEGIGVGVSFAGSKEFGIFVALAIALHNIPEGVAISLSLVPSGVSIWNAAGWSIVTSLPQPLMALPAYLGVKVFAPLLPAGLGFAGGAMMILVTSSMIPEALSVAAPKQVAVAVALGAIGMLLVGLLLSL